MAPTRLTLREIAERYERERERRRQYYLKNREARLAYAKAYFRKQQKAKLKAKMEAKREAGNRKS